MVTMIMRAMVWRVVRTVVTIMKINVAARKMIKRELTMAGTLLSPIESKAEEDDNQSLRAIVLSRIACQTTLNFEIKGLTYWLIDKT